MAVVLALAKVVLVLFSLLVLASIGGAAAPAAPFLIPLLWIAARSSSHAWQRWLYSVLAGGIAFEAMWIAMYSVAGGNVSELTWIPIFVAAFVTTAANGISTGRRKVTLPPTAT